MTIKYFKYKKKTLQKGGKKMEWYEVFETNITEPFRYADKFCYKTVEDVTTEELIQYLEEKGIKVQKEKSKVIAATKTWPGENPPFEADLLEYIKKPEGNIKGYKLQIIAENIPLELTVKSYYESRRKRPKPYSPSGHKIIGFSMSDYETIKGITGEIKYKGDIKDENRINKVIEKVETEIKDYFSVFKVTDEEAERFAEFLLKKAKEKEQQEN